MDRTNKMKPYTVVAIAVTIAAALVSALLMILGAMIWIRDIK